MTTLPTDSQERKEFPMFRGLLRYFPAALAGVARHSKRGNDKHNPGEEMHHARGKSSDHADCIVRHLVDIADMLAAIERGQFSASEQPAALLAEADALVWRACALSQELYETHVGAPLAPGARLPSDPGAPPFRCPDGRVCDGTCPPEVLCLYRTMLPPTAPPNVETYVCECPVCRPTPPLASDPSP